MPVGKAALPVTSSGRWPVPSSWVLFAASQFQRMSVRWAYKDGLNAMNYELRGEDHRLRNSRISATVGCQAKPVTHLPLECKCNWHVLLHAIWQMATPLLPKDSRPRSTDKNLCSLSLSSCHASETKSLNRLPTFASIQLTILCLKSVSPDSLWIPKG